MLAEIFIILLLILLNGIFAASEIALVSSRKARLEVYIKKGNRAAAEALRLHRAPNRFLSTVQIGITLISILTGLYSGAAFAPFFEPFLRKIPFLAEYSHNISVTLVVLIITFLTLVFGELVPKRIGLIIPERFAMWVAWPMNLLSKIAAPFVWLLSTTTDLIIRLFNLRSDKNKVTEEEIKALVEEGVSAGAIEEIEHQIVDRVFNLGDKRVLHLMTYRSDIVWLDINDDTRTHKSVILKSNHNAYPVCDGDLDHILGIVRVKHLLNNYLNDAPLQLKALIQPASFIHETASAYQVLRQFRKTKSNHAFIIDEYGALQGLITMNNLLYSLLGTQSGGSPFEHEKIKRNDGSWLIDGQYPLIDFLEEFDLSPEEEARGINTVGGLLMHQIEGIPKTGDNITWSGMKLEIVDMDGRRIDKIQLWEQKKKAE